MTATPLRLSDEAQKRYDAYPTLVAALREALRDITVRDSEAERVGRALLRELGESA